MSKLTLLFGLILVACNVQAEQNWYSFQTTWAALPFQGFFNQPRTVDEALDAGWTQVSNDCSDGATFPGNRYASPGMEMVIIYDVNGYISGMHSVVPKDKTNDAFDFSTSRWYRADTVNGVEAYLTTAYFVDPAVICTGRSQAEYDQEGTGNRLLFQNGPTSSDTISAPLTIDDADTNAAGWFKHFCFVNMGRHYFQLNYDVDASCDDLTPIQLVFSGGVLNAFVWQHPTTIEGDLWESVNSFALGQIVDRPPNCLYDIVNSVGVTTMHTYLRNYDTLCFDDKNQ